MNTPVRTVRVDDETWSAVEDRATKEGTTVSEIVRAALRRYVGVVLTVLALAVGLSACGGTAPSAAPEPSATSSTPSLDEARAQVAAEQQAKADAALDAKARAKAGLCTDTTRGSEFYREWNGQPYKSGPDVRREFFASWIAQVAGLPDGCTARDQKQMGRTVESAKQSLANLTE